jgi:hypothetical protein
MGCETAVAHAFEFGKLCRTAVELGYSHRPNRVFAARLLKPGERRDLFEDPQLAFHVAGLDCADERLDDA